MGCCHHCGEEEAIPFKCNRCDEVFCPEHRLPEKHECPGVGAVPEISRSKQDQSEPRYTTKWRCKDCRQLYGHNPTKCDVCDNTTFRPVPADGASDTHEKGTSTTELGADLSDLLDDEEE